jgi:hypothetical protein
VFVSKILCIGAETRNEAKIGADFGQKAQFIGGFGNYWVETKGL